MKIYNREQFLKLPPNTVFCKWYRNDFAPLEIKVSAFGEWGNDFITDNLTDYLAEPYRDLDEFKVGDSNIRWDDNQTVRDGLYETDDEVLFAVFDNEDIFRVISKLTKCLI